MSSNRISATELDAAVERELAEALGRFDGTGPMLGRAKNILAALKAIGWTASPISSRAPVERSPADRLGAWMSAALDDPAVCDAMKEDIHAWFDAGQPLPAPAPAGEDKPCGTCQGNGEVVTDWDRYQDPHSGDKGDEAVAPCPDCDGTGEAAPTPPQAQAGEVHASRLVDACGAFWRQKNTGTQEIGKTGRDTHDIAAIRAAFSAAGLRIAGEGE